MKYAVLAQKLEQPKRSVPVDQVKLRELRRLVRDALDTDGEHHKQWYLWQIGKKLGMCISDTDTMEGIPP
jgi:hypothetical protein